MLFLDGVYVVGANGKVEWFRSVRAPTTTELAELTHTLAERVGRIIRVDGVFRGDRQHLPQQRVVDVAASHAVCETARHA